MSDTTTHCIPDEQTDPIPTRLVLIADDDPDFLVQHSAVLKSLGFDVVAAESRDQAMMQLETHTLALAIVDLVMEESDSGFALCHEIRKRYPYTPIIVVTSASAMTGNDFESLQGDQRTWFQADAVLAKPVQFDQLAGHISRLLDR